MRESRMERNGSEVQNVHHIHIFLHFQKIQYLFKRNFAESVYKLLHID